MGADRPASEQPVDRCLPVGKKPSLPFLAFFSAHFVYLSIQATKSHTWFLYPTIEICCLPVGKKFTLPFLAFFAVKFMNLPIHTAPAFTSILWLTGSGLSPGQNEFNEIKGQFMLVPFLCHG